MAKIHLDNHFSLKETQSSAETVAYLAQLTRLMERRFLNKMLDTQTYGTLASFNESNTKTKQMLLGELWIRQLMTIKGLTAAKAQALAKEYPTCFDFMSQEPEAQQLLGKSVWQKLEQLTRAQVYES